VKRGPYLQTGSSTSVTVKWRTDVSTDSCVRYDTSLSSLNSKTCSSTSTTDHVVKLSSLSSNTKYYYSIGTSAGSIAGDSTYFFLTAPQTGTTKATRIWVLGDSGTADSSQRAVRDAYYTYTGSRHTDLWLMLGDNAYSDGTDSEYQGAVFDIYPTMLRKSVLWPTFGNHDSHSADSSSQSGPYYDIFTLPKNGEAGGVASGTEAYYSFNYANIHFVCLDSTDSNRSPSGAMLTWLKSDLAANTQQWLIAYWHHPPYSKGSHDSDSESELEQMRQYANPILESHGVDLVLSGHSHSYERSYLLNGHYGSSSTLTSAMILDKGDGRVDGTGAYEKPVALAPNKGAVYTVAGSSGQTSGGSLDHPAMYISFNVLGSLVLDVNGAQLDAKFLNSSGSVQDHFTIKKDLGAPSAFNFSLTNGGSKAVSQGASVANSISAALVSGTAQSVTFSASGLPTGATAAFSPTACTPTCSTALTIKTSSTTPIGTSTITVKGIAGAVAKTTSFSLTVNPASTSFNFSLTNGGSKAVSQGASVSNSISAALVSGTTQSVSFSASGLPTGASALFSSTACSPTCSTTLTIKTPSTTPTGTSTLTVTGKGGVVTKTTSFSLTVAAPGSTKTISFQDGVLPTSSYAGTRDTAIDQTAPTSNYGTATTLRVDGDDGTGKDVYALLRWGSLTIPTGSTVKSVTLTLNVTNPTSGTYELYALKRNWVETGATWNQYASGSNWLIAGAKGTADRGTTVLGTVTASSTGKRTIILNAAGIALVQSWVNSPSTNNGILIADPIVSDGLVFDSRNALTASNRPKLTVTYVAP